MKIKVSPKRKRAIKVRPKSSKKKTSPRTAIAKKKAVKEYKKVAAKSKPGSGKRFTAVEKIAKASGVKNPGALAAYIGRKKYGKAGMAKMAAKGRKRAAARRKK